MYKGTNQDGWIITHDGEHAWLWSNPENRVNIKNINEFTNTHNILADDRTKPGRNVWD